jgi:hypothetical protein
MFPVQAAVSAAHVRRRVIGVLCPRRCPAAYHVNLSVDARSLSFCFLFIGKSILPRARDEGGFLFQEWLLGGDYVRERSSWRSAVARFLIQHSYGAVIGRLCFLV